MLTATLRAQARNAYNGALSTNPRIRYVHEYLLSRIWYVAQIYPPYRGTTTPTQHDYFMVFVTWGNIPGTALDTAQKERIMGLGIDTHGREMHTALHSPYARTEDENALRLSGMDA
jgi:hypothetical protein